MKKHVILFLTAFLGILMTACVSKIESTTIKGELIESYDIPGEKPFISTYAGGTYYSLCTEYGAQIYDLSVSDTLGKVQPIYTAESVDILNLEANDRYVTWGERHVRGDSTDIMVYDVSSEQIMSVYSMKALPENDGILMLQYPLSKLYDDSVYFVERGENGYNTRILRCCITDHTEEELYVFNEFYGYQPALQISGSHLMGVIDAENERIGILILDLESGNQSIVRLSEDIDRVFAADYDSERNELYLYYHTKETNKERVGIYSVHNNEMKNIYYLSSQERFAVDEIENYEKYLIWRHYKKPKTETTELTSLYSLLIFDKEKERFYEFEDGFDYFIKDQELYVYSFAYNQVNNLSVVKLP